MAACPTVLATGTASEILEANSARLVCLQQDLAAQTARRTYEFDLKALDRQMQDAQMQRRLDTITPPPPAPVFIP